MSGGAVSNRIAVVNRAGLTWIKPVNMESVIPSGIPPIYTVVVLTAGFTKFGFSIPPIPPPGIIII